ncbi:APC family permease [Paractinoplanes rishiriensis]|uniref:Amino acid permease n=1 Tax=Paractinoplanes rishiriensis TaxID=1050105 RepID=A0A919N219_9ACTN|nr:APC family permease [Actinoplanes rishiriensis]GIE98392.1 amino acid permease [Actinoplanes rishiriensis]
MGTDDEPSQTLAPGRIGAAAVTFFAIAATAPIAVLVFVVPAAYARGGGPLVPLSIVAVGAVLVLFAAAYAAMAHRAPYAGAMYAYVSRGLGRPGGLAAGWLALLSYQALQLGLYGVAGLAAAPLLRNWFQIDAQWWMVAWACWLLVALCGLLSVEVASGLFALLVIVEVAVIAGFAAANVIQPAGGDFTADTIIPGPVDRPALGLLLAVAALAFVGFETTGTYAEEVMRPRREAGHATYAAVLILTVLLAFAAWSVSAGAGSGQVSRLARARGSELVFDLAGARLAPWAVTLGRVLLLVGLFAAMLALHNAMSRYLFALGRERVLPAALSRTSVRSGSPQVASLTQSLVAGLILTGAYLAGVTAPTILASRLSVVGGVGILLILLATGLSALLHLNRVPNGEGTWGRFLAPILSTVAIGTLCYLALWNLPGLLGVPPESSLVWLVPPALAVLGGTLHGAALRGTRPVIYAGIGQGGVPVVVTPQAAPDIPSQRTPGAHRPERVKR